MDVGEYQERLLEEFGRVARTVVWLGAPVPLQVSGRHGARPGRSAAPQRARAVDRGLTAAALLHM